MPKLIISTPDSIMDFLAQVVQYVYTQEVIGIAVAIETKDDFTTHQYNLNGNSLAIVAALFKDYSMGLYLDHTVQ